MEAWRQLSSRQLSLEELLALEHSPHLFAKWEMEWNFKNTIEWIVNFFLKRCIGPLHNYWNMCDLGFKFADILVIGNRLPGFGLLIRPTRGVTGSLYGGRRLLDLFISYRICGESATPGIADARSRSFVRSSGMHMAHTGMNRNRWNETIHRTFKGLPMCLKGQFCNNQIKVY